MDVLINFSNKEQSGILDCYHNAQGPQTSQLKLMLTIVHRLFTDLLLSVGLDKKKNIHH